MSGVWVQCVDEDAFVDGDGEVIIGGPVQTLLRGNARAESDHLEHFHIEISRRASAAENMKEAHVMYV